MNNSNESNPMKKRKASAGRPATAEAAPDVNASSNNKDCGSVSSFSGRGDDISSGPYRDGNKASQLDRMEKMMIRMEEKLAHREQPREPI